jgi:hypothetical protein
MIASSRLSRSSGPWHAARSHQDRNPRTPLRQLLTVSGGLALGAQVQQERREQFLQVFDT